MARLSIGDALGDGFGLIGRRPLDCVAWGVAYFVLAFLPAMLIFGWVFPDYMALMRDFAANPDAARGFQGAPLAMQMKLQAMQPVFLLSTIVGRSVVYSAIFRAVIRPQERGFFHLRLSSAELWVGLVLLVQYVCIWLTMVGLVLLATLFWVPTFVAAAHNSLSGWEIPVGAIGVLAAAAVFIWLVIRFSMAMPMTFAQQQFRLFESWSLTRGKALGLCLLYLVVGVVVMVCIFAIEIVCAILVFTVLGLNLGEASFQAFIRQPPDQLIAAVAPWVLGIGFVWAIIAGFISAVTVGAWASAYRQLAPQPVQP